MAELWTEKEEKLLKDNYSKLDIDNLLMLLPNRSKKSISAKAKKLKLRKSNFFIWTNEHTEILKNNASLPDKELAKLIGCKVSCVDNRRKLHNLRKYKLNTNNNYKICNNYVIIYVHKDNAETKEFLISLEDLGRVIRNRWYVKKNNYVMITKKDSISLHRFIMNCPKGMVVDHINGNPLDNRRENLRICTMVENNQNITKFNGLFRGVIETKWGYRISFIKNKKNIDFGFYKDRNEAIAIAKYALKYIFPNSYLVKDINQSDIPQWIKDKVDSKLNKVA